MALTISNGIYYKQDKFDGILLNKSNLITSFVDIVFITTASVIGGLMLNGKITFGLKDIKTIKIIAWSSIALGGGIALADIITVIMIKYLQGCGTDAYRMNIKSSNFKLEKNKSIDAYITRIDFSEIWTNGMPPAGACTVTFVNGQKVQGSISGVDAYVLTEAIPDKCFFTGQTQHVTTDNFKDSNPVTWTGYGYGTSHQVLEALVKQNN